MARSRTMNESESGARPSRPRDSTSAFKGLLEIGKILGLKTDEMDRLLEARVEAAVYESRASRAVLLNRAAKTHQRVRAGSKRRAIDGGTPC